MKPGTEQFLIIAGSGILLILGFIHLAYTFLTKRLYPKNNEVVGILKKEHPILTNGTTMWKAWVGFNASHSAGIIFFAKMNILLVLFDFQLLREPSFLVLDNGFVLFYLFLAIKYWFRTPLLGVFLASICFVLATTLILIH